MSRTWVWLVAAASTAFVASAGVVLGLRLAGAQTPAEPARGECAAQVERLRQESQQLRRLVAAYRQREALYRQRLGEANRLLERLAGGDRRAWRSADRWEREEHERRERWEDDD
ncbi:MAG: hypothetical protein ACK45F_02765 [bacterium]